MLAAIEFLSLELEAVSNPKIQRAASQHTACDFSPEVFDCCAMISF